MQQAWALHCKSATWQKLLAVLFAVWRSSIGKIIKAGWNTEGVRHQKKNDRICWCNNTCLPLYLYVHVQHTHTTVLHVVRQAMVTWPWASAYCSYESRHPWTTTGQERRENMMREGGMDREGGSGGVQGQGKIEMRRGKVYGSSGLKRSERKRRRWGETQCITTTYN